MGPDPDRVEEFIELLAQYDHSLNAFVVSLVPTTADAQDILQETKLALWRSMDQFKAGSNFGAWARQTALHRVLDYRKRKGRESRRIWFTDECIELLAEECESAPEYLEDRGEKLRGCIAKLQPGHREILVLRYFKDSSIDEVAARVNRTVEATYRVLSRIRLALRKCLSGSLPSNSAP